MVNRTRRIASGAAAFFLVVLAFGGGWIGYDRYHGDVHRLAGFKPGLFAPPGFASVDLPSTSNSLGLVPLERVDVLAMVDGELRPLVLDALVESNSTRNLRLFVSAGDRPIFGYARKHGIMLHYRPTIVPSQAAYEDDVLRAQEKLRPRAAVQIQPTWRNAFLLEEWRVGESQRQRLHRIPLEAGDDRLE